jgi:IclR family acetate operon transcriptional repressor
MQALSRLMQIIEAVTDAPSGATPTEVSSAVGLSLSTTSRIMHQLVDAEVLERAESTGRYLLGIRLTHIVQKAARHTTSQTATRAAIQRLRDLSGETVSLHIRVAAQRICIESAQSPQPVARVVHIGLALPLIGSATGEVLLSAVAEPELSLLINSSALPSDERVAFRRRLLTVREQGWSLIADEWVAGVTGVSAVVPNLGGDSGALSISGPSGRFGSVDAQRLVPALLEASRDLFDPGLLVGQVLARRSR